MTIRTRMPALVALATTVAVVGAGAWMLGAPPSLDRGEAQRQADAIASLVAEGELLAGVVADGHGVDRATKVHAAELAEALGTSATMLDTGHVPSASRRGASDASRLAHDAERSLEQLAAHPGDERRAARTERELHALGSAADRAAKAVGS